MTGVKPSQAVVNAIADYQGLSPSEVEPKLYTVIEPDALDRLFESTPTGDDRSNGHVSFTYGDVDVRVDADGNVSLEERATV